MGEEILAGEGEGEGRKMLGRKAGHSTMSYKGDVVSGPAGAISQVSGLMPSRIPALEHVNGHSGLSSWLFSTFCRPLDNVCLTQNFWELLRKADVRPSDVDSQWSWEVEGEPAK